MKCLYPNEISVFKNSKIDLRLFEIKLQEKRKNDSIFTIFVSLINRQVL